jgi:hypothetical protein
MKNTPSPKTTTQDKKVRSHSFFGACLSGLVAFVILGSLFESVCRLGLADAVLPMQSVGNYHTQFEIKWFKLEEYVKQNGGVDVILLGNSMVNTGVDPKVVAARYKELTGQDARIFNFGVEGLTVAPLADLAQILMEKYHPRVIILYTEMRDYIAGNGDTVASDFLASPWVQQQLGNPSIEGFLENNSVALQHLLPFRYASRPDFLDTYLLDVRRLDETTKFGYEAARGTGKDVTKEPDPSDPAEAATYKLFVDYSMDPARIDSLKSVLAFTDQKTTVIVSEMPIYPTYYSYLEKESDREDYLAALEEIVAENGGHFLTPVDFHEIRDSGFNDNHHLNYIGAPIYSNLLGEQLAGLCTDQQVCLGEVLP